MSGTVPFNLELDFEYGVSATVSPLVRRVIARNPSAFTFHGTGTYIVGHGDVAVIDAGPNNESHIAALLNCLGDERVTHLVVTHTHLDHSPACRPLQALTQAPTYGFGPHGSAKGLSGDAVEEGADWDFTPDVVVQDGDKIEGPGWTLEALHTPGHTSNHLCYFLRQENALFSGDHVMGWSTTIVAPPDGDMSSYLKSLRLLLARSDERYFPTHGAPIDQPRNYVRSLLAHRQQREAQVLACLQEGSSDIRVMVEKMYPHLDVSMHGAAAMQVYSTLLYLCEQEQVISDQAPSLETRFRLA